MGLIGTCSSAFHADASYNVNEANIFVCLIPSSCIIFNTLLVDSASQTNNFEFAAFY